MKIIEATRESIKEGCGIRRTTWEEGRFIKIRNEKDVYMEMPQKGRRKYYAPTAADLKADDWELKKEPSEE